jgi:hypothetical protein
MRMRRTGRPVHHGIIKIEKNLRRLFSNPIKFERKQESSLNTDRIEQGKLAVKDQPFPPRTGEGLPLRFHLVSNQVGEILLYPKSVALLTGMGEENDSQFAPFDFFSAITKIDLAKSMPRYR